MTLNVYYEARSDTYCVIVKLAPVFFQTRPLFRIGWRPLPAIDEKGCLMTRIKKLRSAMAMSFVFLGSFALAQTAVDSSGVWDPITGLPDGNTATRASAGSSSRGGGSSFWADYQRPDLGTYSQPPATFGGIVITRDGRRCGGLFRSVSC